MTQIDALLDANRRYVGSTAAATGTDATDARPRRQLAVLTCMDSRIDVLGALGLRLGDAMVVRNAGGRVTDDVLRSLALATHVLGVDTIVLVQHTGCGVYGVTDAELRTRTGHDVDFLVIDDHAVTLRADVERLAAAPYLAPIQAIGGLVYDVASGELSELVRWHRGG